MDTAQQAIFLGVVEGAPLIFAMDATFAVSIKTCNVDAGLRDPIRGALPRTPEYFYPKEDGTRRALFSWIDVSLTGRTLPSSRRF